MEENEHRLRLVTDSSLEVERWTSIPGFPWYSVSTKGRVRNDNSKRNLSPWIDGPGYLRVSLYGNSRKKFKYVHRLVLIAFVSEPPPNTECNHKDGIKSNCFLNNLEWVTKQENQRHAYAIGLNYGYKGAENPNSKLTDEKVYEIRLRRNNGENLKDIADDYSVTAPLVSAICSSKLWKHIGS